MPRVGVQSIQGTCNSRKRCDPAERRLHELSTAWRCSRATRIRPGPEIAPGPCHTNARLHLQRHRLASTVKRQLRQCQPPALTASRRKPDGTGDAPLASTAAFGSHSPLWSLVVVADAKRMVAQKRNAHVVASIAGTVAAVRMRIPGWMRSAEPGQRAYMKSQAHPRKARSPRGRAWMRNSLAWAVRRGRAATSAKSSMLDSHHGHCRHGGLQVHTRTP